MSAPILVVIDTDPGLDDAVAILHALVDERFAVAAMTAVAGNIGIATTTRNIGRLLAATGRDDIPYCAGAAAPLEGQGLDEEAIHGADGLGGVALPEPLAAPEKRSATTLFCDVLHRRPEGSVTVLALGPLTNLARLALDAPDAYRRIGRIIAMGGTFAEKGNAGPHAEFNVAADPEAARVVLAGGVPLTLIPLDVTRKLRATPDDLNRLGAAGTTAARLAADLIRAYFADHADRDSRPLHDPCVMLMAVAPHLFGVERMALSVDCETHRGRLIVDPAGAAVNIAMTVDAPRALETLWAGLGAG